MKKLALIAVAFVFTAFSFAQNKGQWSFGAGGDFTAPDANANIGYFALDGMMVSFDFEMTMDHRVEHIEEDGERHLHDEEGDFTWGGAVRYYAVDNMFVEAGMRMSDPDEDPDTHLAGGVSLELGFEGRLWFEPMIKFSMPGADYSTEANPTAAQNTLGLAWAFRYTF